MPLKLFSSAVDERFRIKIAFDTNLLMYLLNNEYPKLNNAVAELNKYNEFVELITNRYAFFELCEKRKEFHFIKYANENGYNTNRIKSDKFIISKNSRVYRLFSSILNLKILNKWSEEKIKSFIEKLPSKNKAAGEGLFFQYQREIMEAVNLDMPKVEDELGISLRGTIHDNIWGHTFELILNSRISREDSLIAIAFLLPYEIRSEKNFIILTNDGDFESFYKQAKKRGLISPLFAKWQLEEFTIDRISELKRFKNGKFNLKNLIPCDVQSNILEYIKQNIIDRNSEYFLGFTDSRILPGKSNIIGLGLEGDAEYTNDKYLLVIGNNLDFIYTLPNPILSFHDKHKKQIEFPLTKEHKSVCFIHDDIDTDDADKKYEAEIRASLKQSGNLVFVLPD